MSWRLWEVMEVLTHGTWKSGYAHAWKYHCMEQSWIHRQPQVEVEWEEGGYLDMTYLRLFYI